MDYGSVYRIKVLGEKEREESKSAGLIVLNILVVINHQIPSYIMPSCLMTYRSINLVKIHQRTGMQFVSWQNKYSDNTEFS